MNPRYFVVLGVIGLLSPSQTTAQRRSVQIRHLHMANPTMTTALGGAALAATPTLDVVPWKPAASPAIKLVRRRARGVAARLLRLIV
jgi:hypothetical protein